MSGMSTPLSIRVDPPPRDKARLVSLVWLLSELRAQSDPGAFQYEVSSMRVTRGGVLALWWTLLPIPTGRTHF